jgi:hypothetical protein
VPGQSIGSDYQSVLRKLRERLLLMGASVEEMISHSVRALVGRDSELARRMIRLPPQDPNRNVRASFVESAMSSGRGSKAC